MKKKKNPNQLDLLSKDALRYAKSWSHGGSILKKRRKVARPLVPKKITHVMFKSSKAKGKLSFLTHQQRVSKRLHERAKRFHITIHDFVNMGNHLHLKISCNDIKNIKLFLRTFAGLLARDLTGAHKGSKFGKFWDTLVFTRVLHSSLEELGLRGYFEGNRRERDMGKAERDNYLKSWNEYMRKLRQARAKPKDEASFILSLE